jgi:hypothetical protein
VDFKRRCLSLTLTLRLLVIKQASVFDVTHTTVECSPQEAVVVNTVKNYFVIWSQKICNRFHKTPVLEFITNESTPS